MEHPRGKNLLAREIMTARVECLHPGDSMREAVDWLLSKERSGAPVVDEHGKLVGVLSEYDCLEALRQACNERTPEDTVSSYMTKQVATVREETPVLEVCAQFSEMYWRRLVVVDGQGKVCGLIARRDLLRVLRGIVYDRPPSSTYDLIERSRQTHS